MFENRRELKNFINSSIVYYIISLICNWTSAENYAGLCNTKATQILSISLSFTILEHMRTTVRMVWGSIYTGGKVASSISGK